MKYIVALDIGIASVGWAIINKETEKIIESGANIFPEASAASNQMRRELRQTRRLKRRGRTRVNDFKNIWTKNGFIIPDTYYNNIVELKVKALCEKITLEELYMILYNYLKHRGISYLEDATDESVTGNSAYAKGIKFNEKELETKFPCQIQKERLEQGGKYRGQLQLIEENGDKLDLSNVFTISAYRKEIMHILKKQKEYYGQLTDEFCDEYLAIFNRKRKYYEGPGNEKSRTDYGKYTTKLDENGVFVTEKNIFEKLIGKCSIYNQEMRAATASYTAQEYNLLNDLNNLTINGRKLDADEKYEIVKKIKNTNSVNVKKIIRDAIGEKIEELHGARIDKNGKEIFHKFEVYNKMRKSLELIGEDICKFSREELDEIGHILTINTDKESISEAFDNSSLALTNETKECLIELRKTASQLFSKWHSFSLKIMNELIPEMYEQPKEQMTLLTEMGVINGREEDFTGVKYIPVDASSEEIFNPVVRRAVRISYRILNGVIKKYDIPEEIVIEMPRDRNSQEMKDRIKGNQKLNENEKEYSV